MTPSTATYERDGVVATVQYLGVRAWSLSTAGREERHDNASIAAAICSAMKIASPPARLTRITICAEHIRNGVIANNTYPPDAWWYDIDPGAGGTTLDLHEAVWSTLSSLRLAPPNTTPREPFVDPTFSLASLLGASDRRAWATNLGLAAEAWLGADPSPTDIRELMFALRALGHPLYSFDESDERWHWSTSGAERAPHRLDVEVRARAYEPPQVITSIVESEASVK